MANDDAYDRNDAYARLVARVWSDPEFVGRLFHDPDGAMQDLDLNMPAGFRSVLTLTHGDHPSAFNIPNRREEAEEWPELCSHGCNGG